MIVLFSGLPIATLGLFIYKAAERFSFYALRHNQAGYLMSSEGFALTSEAATAFVASADRIAALSGIFIGLVSDIIGQRAALILGSIFVLATHSVTHIHSLNIFFAALIGIKFANHFLKSSTIALLNKVTPKKDLDRTFSLFYQIFNAGAFAGDVLSGYFTFWYGYKAMFIMLFIVVALGNIVGILATGKELLTGDLVPISSDSEEGQEDKIAIESVSYGHIAKGILLYGLLHITFLYYLVLEQLDSHFLQGWMHDFGSAKLFGFNLPASTYTALNPLCVIFFPAILVAFREKFKARGYFKSHFTWSNVGIVVMMFSALALLGVQYEYVHYGYTTPIFFLIYILFLVFGEMIFYPSLLSSPGLLLHPKLYGTCMIALPLISIVASKMTEDLAIFSLKNRQTTYMVIYILVLGCATIVINLIASYFEGNYDIRKDPKLQNSQNSDLKPKE